MTRSRYTFEWTFNRLVMYYNRFVASESCVSLREPLRKAHIFVTKSLSIYLYSISLYFSLFSRPSPSIRRVSRRGWENFHRRLWKSTGNLDIRAIASEHRAAIVGNRDRSMDDDRPGERSTERYDVTSIPWSFHCQWRVYARVYVGLWLYSKLNGVFYFW